MFNLSSLISGLFFPTLLPLHRSRSFKAPLNAVPNSRLPYCLNRLVCKKFMTQFSSPPLSPLMNRSPSHFPASSANPNVSPSLSASPLACVSGCLCLPLVSLPSRFFLVRFLSLLLTRPLSSSLPSQPPFISLLAKTTPS